MTRIGFYFSNYINGVALSHKIESKKMFPDYPINFITNGIHSQTWTCDDLKKFMISIFLVGDILVYH
jgi:starch phosphorylase